MPGPYDETESFSPGSPVPPDVLTSEQLAERIHVDAQTVRKWAHQGRIPAGKTPGGEWRFFWPAVFQHMFGSPGGQGTAHDPVEEDK